MNATSPQATHFTPSSNDLLAMIANAEAKCDSSIEQAALKRNAEGCKRMEQMMVAEAKQRSRKFWEAA